MVLFIGGCSVAAFVFGGSPRGLFTSVLKWVSGVSAQEALLVGNWKCEKPSVGKIVYQFNSNHSFTLIFTPSNDPKKETIEAGLWHIVPMPDQLALDIQASNAGRANTKGAYRLDKLDQSVLVIAAEDDKGQMTADTYQRVP